MFAQTWAGKRPAPKASESTSIIRSAKLKRVHHNQKRSQLAKHRSSVSKNFRRRCAKFYTWVGTAVLRRKRFGLRPCICSITLAMAPQATNHRRDSAKSRSFSPPTARDRCHRGARTRRAARLAAASRQYRLRCHARRRDGKLGPNGTSRSVRLTALLEPACVKTHRLL
jgi:hypothetical protein